MSMKEWLDNWDERRHSKNISRYISNLNLDPADQKMYEDLHYTNPKLFERLLSERATEQLVNQFDNPINRNILQQSLDGKAILTPEMMSNALMKELNLDSPEALQRAITWGDDRLERVMSAVPNHHTMLKHVSEHLDYKEAIAKYNTDYADYLEKTKNGVTAVEPSRPEPTSFMKHMERNTPEGISIVDKTVLKNLNEKEMQTFGRAVINEALKDSGHDLSSFGIRSGWGPDLKQLQAAPLNERLKYLGSAVYDGTVGNLGFTARGRSNIANAIGYIDRSTRIMAANQTPMMRALTYGGTILGGGLSALAALNSEDPGTTLLGGIVSGIVSVSTYRIASASFMAGAGLAGTAVNNVMGNLAKHGVMNPRTFNGLKFLKASHLAGGLSFGLAGIAGAATYSLIDTIGSDLVKSDSAAVDLVRRLAKTESTASLRDNDLNTSMRQRHLQKISASANNYRGQLLGNEAAILKGAPMIF